MTPEEHEHVQKLEAQVKRYRRRIVELKALIPSEHVNVSICSCPVITGGIVPRHHEKCPLYVEKSAGGEEYPE
jgi:hypothetical protein